VIAALKISGVVERIGDHATNAAEMVYFAATGLYFSQREMAALNEKA
jgi:phosphate transport system protein